MPTSTISTWTAADAGGSTGSGDCGGLVVASVEGVLVVGVSDGSGSEEVGGGLLGVCVCEGDDDGLVGAVVVGRLDGLAGGVVWCAGEVVASRAGVSVCLWTGGSASTGTSRIGRAVVGRGVMLGAGGLADTCGVRVGAPASAGPSTAASACRPRGAE